MPKKIRKKTSFKIIIISSVLMFIFLISLYIYKSIHINPPDNIDNQATLLTREGIYDNGYHIKNNFIRENKYGLWELYVEGEAFERGVITGKLSKELIHKQEKAFVNQIKKFIPSSFYRRFLKTLIGWFNRKIGHHIPDEFLKEIYGVSLSASSEFNKYGSPYMRILNYHAAHDIGHALVDYALIGCTSFSLWGGRTADSSIITGRNFDFYVGDEFAEDKIIAFYKPSDGYPFASVTWGGMIGVVSGMNLAGLTVTINAAQSGIPSSSATPITILTREILQYARNIEEAVEIAKKRETFVSESILISSAEDNKTVIIEKSPEKMSVVYPKDNSIICANHFTDSIFEKEEKGLCLFNSLYRYERVKQLLGRYDTINPEITSKILRNKKGLNDINIGMGNENAINQLIAHHAVIFNPHKMIMWVSVNPYNIGPFLAYNLNHIFSNKNSGLNDVILNDTSLTIPADPFLYSERYKDFRHYKNLKKKIQKAIKQNNSLSFDTLGLLVKLNPEYFESYEILGDYHQKKSDHKKARIYYKKALKLAIDTCSTIPSIQEKIENIE